MYKFNNLDYATVPYSVMKDSDIKIIEILEGNAVRVRPVLFFNNDCERKIAHDYLNELALSLAMRLVSFQSINYNLTPINTFFVLDTHTITTYQNSKASPFIMASTKASSFVKTDLNAIWLATLYSTCSMR